MSEGEGMPYNDGLLRAACFRSSSSARLACFTCISSPPLPFSPFRTFPFRYVLLHRFVFLLFNPPLSLCTLQDTLEDIVGRMVASRIHRIFVVDDAGRPLRVVSLGDVFEQYVEEPEGYFGDFFVLGKPVGVGL